MIRINSIKIKNEGQNSLFPVDETSLFYNRFREMLIDILRKEEMSNDRIVEFTIQNGCLPKHAKQELKKLYDLGKIVVFDTNRIQITDARKWNIADDISIKTTFKWISDEKK